MFSSIEGKICLHAVHFPPAIEKQLQRQMGKAKLWANMIGKTYAPPDTYILIYVQRELRLQD